MGGKKKARAKQRQKKSNAKSASSVANEFLDNLAQKMKGQVQALQSIQQVPFHADDNPDALFEHMQTHKTLDSKTLAKCMPNLSEEMRKYHSVPSVSIASERIMQGFVKYSPDVCDPRGKAMDPRHVCSSLTKKALDFVPNYLQLLDEGEVELFQMSFAQKFFDQERSAIATSSRGGDSASGVCFLKDVLEEACLEFQDIFDLKLFGKKEGEFLRLCPLYGIPVDELTPIWNGVVNWEDGGLYNRIFGDVSGALKAVATGILEVRNRCWECDVMPDNLKYCKGCFLACYCSKSCRDTAWKIGHKKTCSELGRQKKFIEASTEIIDNTHETKDETSRLQIMSDYSCLITGIQNWYNLRYHRDLAQFSPSMKMFYSNLELVLNGKLWVIENTQELDTYLVALGAAGSEAYYNERLVTNVICSLLAYDLLGAEGAGNIYHLLATYDTRLPTSRMPRERFLHLYQQIPSWGAGGVAKDHEKDWGRNRRVLIKRVEDAVRDVYEYKSRQGNDLIL